ncbi:Mediator of RNA polymerase II transcription subunit 14 [Metarhizium album ARSEF 1941]|uniref:Mediator of RNA polymerase II transcription subunit 14 n=1 Tax=Metarhizium album (strain ARSEF 1941) TaxID=1081103 RepID=A0A0B2WWQ6_METAS|nr:Mediator of RNA polymerase II transcription subunit 14 [Metarhizium album ARSEF 1941]KHN98498.1 Mediator of RNA polymerase II transcription subunit 14 [Metarhizium album ARSEF 1941]
MESSGHNGTRTDHDRDSSMNGVNGANGVVQGAGFPKEKASDAAATDGSARTINGNDESRSLECYRNGDAEKMTNRMNDLPDEIVHITQGFVPLSLLLTRLAQTSHNALQDKIAEMAKMPLPQAAANGTSSFSSSAPDDSSAENLRKKGALTNFAQEWHGKWLKALVITEWSRKAHLVSKLIDLKFHIDQQRILYDAALDEMVNVKRDLAFARMPSPDLKTALQVLSTGSAPWMPDLGYIEPPHLTPEVQLKWVNELNTLLSLRLNLEDFDKIPYHFRNYEIGSGRVTFKVDGEFEVDLTIADEDFEKQFWFIDFRYAFKPAASSIPESLRNHLENCVNDVLGKEGLHGCYQFLHELVLTTKINELKRQATQLSRTSWIGTLNVEPLNRALSIQYWTGRSTTMGSKSWILIAVNSNRSSNSKEDISSTSRLVAKWYRDNKEVKGGEIRFDVNELSAEALLTNVIARHIEHILSSIRDKLFTAARFKSREASMALRVSSTDPAFSSLTTQVGHSGQISMLVEPMTGVFALKPPSRFTMQPEHQLNMGRNPAEDGLNCLEALRCAIMEDELHRRATLMGWRLRKPPMAAEELKLAIRVRDWTRVICLQKDGWASNWVVVVVLSLNGDEWWLLESNPNETNKALRFQAKLPFNNGYPDLSDTFWENLSFLTTGIIAQAVDIRELHRQKIKTRSSHKFDLCLAQTARLPSTDVALSALFPSMVFDQSKADKDGLSNSEGQPGDMGLLSLIQQASGATSVRKKAWADNIVSITFRGIRCLSKAENGHDGTEENELICTSEAILKVRKPSRFASLDGLADRDVSYNPRRREFALRIQRAVGKPILDTLKSRIKAIDRFVNFLEALESASGTITTESVTLRQITFYYSELRTKETKEEEEEEDQVMEDEPQRWRVVLDLSNDDIDIEIEKGNPHLRVLDLMRQLVNSDGGIGVLTAWLPASLPALQAIDKMETEWEPIQAAGQGRIEFSMKTVAWMSVEYTITSDPETLTHPVRLEVKMQPRRSQAWWHVWRSDAKTDAQDGVSTALQRVWNQRGEDWIGLCTGAAGSPQSGVVHMLLAVDEAVRNAISRGAGAAQGNEVVVLE